MAERVQTYKNHPRLLPAFHFFVLPVLLLNVLNEVRRAWRYPSEGSVFLVVVAAALFALAVLSRTQAVTVQDRVIRLEMRLRMRELLPPDLQTRIPLITREQYVALRFASDAELAGLVRKIAAGELKTKAEIKQQITHWQPDYLRA